MNEDMRCWLGQPEEGSPERDTQGDYDGWWQEVARADRAGPRWEVPSENDRDTPLVALGAVFPEMELPPASSAPRAQPGQLGPVSEPFRRLAD